MTTTSDEGDTELDEPGVPAASVTATGVRETGVPVRSAEFDRMDVTFPAGETLCAAWLYLPVPGPARPGPAIVLGHGLGAVKEMRLDAYAARFAAAGYPSVAFDYRNFGASGGRPRQLLDIHRQLEDWAAAIAYARSLPQVDPDRVALFGSSFGGGHVIVAAAHDPRVAAVISQCPFTSGVAASRTVDMVGRIRLLPRILRDEWARIRHRPPVTVPLAGGPRSAALMNVLDVVPGYLGLVPADKDVPNEVAARIVPRILFHRPGRQAGNVRCPMLFSLCDLDSVAPVKTTRRYAAKAPHGEIRRYPIGHFDIYQGAPFEQAVTDQLAFLHRHLPPERAG